MKLIANLQAIDQKAIREEGIPAGVLMESAGAQVAQALQQHCHQAQRGVIFCGPGNNGGDGFVCARKLYEVGYQSLTVIFTGHQYRAEALANLEKLMLTLPIPLVDAHKQPELARRQIEAADFLIDALFGSGLTRPITGIEAQLITAMNQTRQRSASGASHPWVLAVDLPSGIDSGTGQVLGCAVQADATITLAAAKPGLYLQPGKAHTGTLTVADIGIPPRLLAEDESPIRLITPGDAKSWLPPRLPDSHKYHYGNILVIAGSQPMPGAAVLCSEAAMSAGAGLVTLAAPASVFEQVPLMPEIMRLPLPDSQHIGPAAVAALLQVLTEKKFNTILLGPGLGRAPETVQAILALLEHFKALQIPVIVDADGLHALSENPFTLTEYFILTPHVGEAARLLGIDSATIAAQLLDHAAQLREKTGAQIVLKSASTVVATRQVDPTNSAGHGISANNLATAPPRDLIWISPTGNPGMAKAGSGDVLSGIIAAQAIGHLKSAPWQAAPWGVYLHGLAGDAAAAALTPYGMRASSITQHLPQAFQEVLAP